MITFCLVYEFLEIYQIISQLYILHAQCDLVFQKAKHTWNPLMLHPSQRATIYSTIHISVYLYEVKVHKNVAMCIISLLLFSSCSYGWRHTGIKTMAIILRLSLHCLLNTTWVHRIAIIFMIYFVFEMRESLNRERCNGLHILFFTDLCCEWLVHYI